MTAQLRAWARALGGDVSGAQVLCPGPGHSASDRSLSVKIGKDGQPFVYSHSHCGDDWQTCLDYVRQRLGLPAWRPNGHDSQTTVYEFRDPATGEVRYHKERIDRADGSKTFVIKPKGRGGSEPLLYGGEQLSDLVEGQPVFIAEGEKKVDRLRELGTTAISLDAGAKSKWLPAHAKLLRGLQIILWPDSDEPGEGYVAHAAAAIRDENPRADIRVVRPFGAPNGQKGRDICDWKGNAADLAVLASDARVYEAPQQEAAPDRRRRTHAQGRCAMPKMALEWFGEAADSALSEPATQLIEGLLDEGGLSVNYGDSGSGKTFVTLDLGFHVGAGLEWNGKKVKRGLVVYVAAEGGRRIKRRIAALQNHYREEYGDVAPDPFFALVRYQIDLRSSDADLNALLALVREAEKKTGEKCVWLIVDTLSRAMAGGDENSPVDMGRIVASADRFRAWTGAHFTYVHHTGKDAARGARGHSLLRAATDTETETTAGSFTLTKQRDGELGFKIGFKLIDLVIGDDAAGNCIKSAVVEWSAVQAPKTKTKLEPAPSRRLLMSVIDQALGECGFQFTPWADGPVVCCVKDSIVRDRYFARIAEPEDDADKGKAHERKRKAWFRSVKAALDAKALLAAPYEGDRVLWKP